MNITKLLDELKIQLNESIHFLNDKPEETIDSTINACWFAAYGSPKSAEEAAKHPLPELTEEQITALHELIKQRLKNIPLAHITRRQNFMGVELLSDSRALIPRKETEILGEKALEISRQISEKIKRVRVMDICCGSGNLALALASLNTNAVVFATDLSDDAVALTKDNIAFLNLNKRVMAFQGDMFSAFENEEHYLNTDLIVCNPPYISSSKVTKMNAEIASHEPALAFDGGMFGTKIIQSLLLEAPRFLKEGGSLLFEVGVGQGEFILRLCNDSTKYSNVKSMSDHEGNIRVILAQKRIEKT
ncbi:MAG: peptide chain release factor N(5)-glutamine methyltransferase [Ginsengibacter sp.]